jgi:hypothetical protein
MWIYCSTIAVNLVDFGCHFSIRSGRPFPRLAAILLATWILNIELCQQDDGSLTVAFTDYYTHFCSRIYAVVADITLDYSRFFLVIFINSGLLALMDY